MRGKWTRVDAEWRITSDQRFLFIIAHETHLTDFKYLVAKAYASQIKWRSLGLRLRYRSSVQLLSCVWLCGPMDCSTPGFPVHHQLLELTQTHVHWVGDAIQPSHPLSSPYPPTFSLSQHRGLFKWVSSSHQVAKGLEFQLQHQSFQWTPTTDFL